MDLLGYVSLHRKLLESRVFNNADLLKVWIWCLLKANHEEAWVKVQTGRGATEVKLERGQFVFGRKTASNELKMSESSIRNRMGKLKKMQNIDVKADTHFSIVTICNWASYQIKKTKKDRQEDNHRTGIGQPEDTNNNDNNDNNDNKRKGEGEEMPPRKQEVKADTKLYDYDSEPDYQKLYNLYPRPEKFHDGFLIWKQLKTKNILPPTHKVVESLKVQLEYGCFENNKFDVTIDKWLDSRRWLDNPRVRADALVKRDQSIPPVFWVADKPTPEPDGEKK